jgi:iron(III) transport system substrate-binding protein
MMRPVILAALVALLLTGCESRVPSAPVVVLATGAAGSELDLLFADFSSKTDIPVSVVWGDSAANANRLLNNVDDSVDVIITTNVADIWRAADEGVLRPIKPEVLVNVATILQDSDGLWAAIEMRLHAIAMASGQVRPAIASYDELAAANLRGRVCLSSSGLHINRSLIAMLINERGAKKTERLVRLWIQNLAVAPFPSQEALITAMREGLCDYGILEWRPNEDDLMYFIPQPTTMDIDGIGVARHAQQPEKAQQLVAWLLREKSIRPAGDFEASPVGIAGWRDEDARLLAERAGYR